MVKKFINIPLKEYILKIREAQKPEENPLHPAVKKVTGDIKAPMEEITTMQKSLIWDLRLSDAIAFTEGIFPKEASISCAAPEKSEPSSLEP